jgi:hypothetical protein
VTAGGLRGGAVALPGNVSSQFVTALMLVAPATDRGIRIELTSPLVSRPYLAITQAVMAAFGVEDVTVAARSVTVGHRVSSFGRSRRKARSVASGPGVLLQSSAPLGRPLAPVGGSGRIQNRDGLQRVVAHRARATQRY